MFQLSRPSYKGLAVIIVAGAAIAAGTIMAQSPAGKAEAQPPGNRGDGKQRPNAAAAPEIPANVELQRDVVYGKSGNVELLLDIYRPKPLPAGPLPVIVYIHGGGWSKGSKDNSADKLVPLVERGYCGVSINYRLTPSGVQFPEPLYDCKCAIRFLRAKAKELQLDPDRIGVWGHSAGAHLAALLGTTAHLKEFEGTGGWPEFSSRVQAVVAQASPVEFALLLQETQTIAEAEPAIKALLGGHPKERQKQAQLASPLTHIDTESAPFLILHGDADPLVPFSQAQLLYATLKRASVPVKLQIGKGRNHGYNDRAVLTEFLDEQLKTAKVPPLPKVSLRPTLSREKRSGLVLPAALPFKHWTLPDEGPAGPPQPPPDPKTGHRVEWEGWSFNWSLRTREGLVLQDVSFQGRKILKYAGLAEIFVAYDQGAQSVDFAIRHSGYGPLALLPGIDCASGNWCKSFDAEGKPPAAPGQTVVLMHEEKTGPNYLGMFGRVPGKMLVLWSTMCFSYPDDPDGYIYIIRWRFRDDGTLMPEVGVTGAPRHLAQGNTSSVGALVGKDLLDHKVFAESHVHNYLFRLDFAIDGADDNAVEEFNWQREQGGNRGQQARCLWTPITEETGRPCNAETFRSWRVVNRNSRNALGHARSYQLVPGNTGVYRSEKQPATQADLWVTLAKPTEFSYSTVDSRTSLQALPTYVNGESVEGKSAVLWYWLGFHHFPRAEDFLHQPAVWQSFELMPRDFLDSSPLKPDQ
jgi:acetyl esterase/lipase